MIRRLNELLERAGRPAIRLEYGEAGIFSADSGCEITDAGMRFSSNWRFEPGTEMAVTCNHSRCQSFCADGVVVECEALDQRNFRTTLYFLEKQNPPDMTSSGFNVDAAQGGCATGKLRLR